MRRIFVIAVVLLVGVGIGIGIYFAVTGGSGHAVEAGVQHYIHEVRPNTFSHVSATGGIGDFIDMRDGGNANYRNSYLTFNSDFTIATVRFTGPANQRIYQFSILNVNNRARQTNMSLVGIISGRVVHMDLVATNSFITITSTRDYTIRIETADERGVFTEVINRHSILLRFRVGGDS